MKTVCITGGNGLLGSKLLVSGREKYQLISLDVHPHPIFQCPGVKYIQCDITDRNRIEDIVRGIRPDAIFHTAAFTDVDKCEIEKEKCWDINVKGTENIALVCKAIGAKLLHVSTDYIFDAQNGPYDETASPFPISYYGKTKWESEKKVTDLLSDFIIVRSTVLYGYSPRCRLNFVTWLIEKLRANQKVFIVDDQYGTPTLADELAEAMWRLFEADKKGVYHVAGKEWITRYEFAQQVAEIFGFSKALILKTNSIALNQPAPRPLKGGLKTNKIEKELGISFSDARMGLLKVKVQMDSHAK